MIMRTRMIAMVMDMIHEVKKASTAAAVVPFPNRFLSKKSPKELHWRHPSVHPFITRGARIQQKNFDKHNPPHSCWLFLEEAKNGLPFFFYQRSLSGAIYGLMFADGNQLLQLLLRYPTSSATSIQEASRQLHGRWRVEQKSGWNYWKWWENMKQIDRGRLSRLMGGCRD